MTSPINNILALVDPVTAQSNIENNEPMTESSEEQVAKCIEDCFRTKSDILILNELKLETLPETIGDLTHLEILDLTDNNLKNGLPDLSKLQNLKCLDLSGNKLTALPDWVLNLNFQCYVYLDGNPFDDDEFERLLKITESSVYKGPELHYVTDSGDKLDVLARRIKIHEKRRADLDAIRKVLQSTLPDYKPGSNRPRGLSLSN